MLKRVVYSMKPAFPTAREAAYATNNAKAAKTIESFSDMMVLGELIWKAAKRCERELRFPRPNRLTLNQENALGTAINSGFGVEIGDFDIVIRW